VAGLVAVTPASGYVTPLSALVIGLLAGAVCYSAVALKPVFKYDDSLDAFGVHGVGGFLGALLTGALASAALWMNANGYTAADGIELGKVAQGWAAQLGMQLLAAVAAAVYGFVLTLVLVKVIDVVWGFNLDAKAEGEGLDRSEHGEVGFDLGPALEEVPEAPAHEPRPATVPPNGKRHFTVVVEGPPREELMQTWSALCQAGPQPPAEEFRAVYPYLTTVQGNRFNFRGGDPYHLRDSLQRLFQDRLDGTPIRTHIEG
jgi:hypothetical protein